MQHSHRIQLDPVFLLYQLNAPVEAAQQVARLLRTLRLLQVNLARVPVVCGERMYGQLWIGHSQAGYHLYDHPLEDEVKRLIRSFLGKVIQVRESSFGCDAELRCEITGAHRCANVADLVSDWEASLADACEDGDSRVTSVVCDKDFRLINEGELALFCLCNDRESNIAINLISDLSEIAGRVGLIDWDMYEIVDPPVVHYEDSGHQPTAKQKAVLQDVVTRTRLICYAGTTYFNPNVGSQGSTIRGTDRRGEFEFAIFDSGCCARGVFRTRADDQHSEAAVLRYIECEFRRQLEKRSLA